MNDFIVVFSAELMRRLKSRPFQIGIIIGVLGILAFVKLPTLMAGAFDSSGSTVVLAGDPIIANAAKPLLNDYKVAAVVPGSAAPSEADMKARHATSWIVFAKDASGGIRFTLYSHNPKDSAGESIANDLSSFNVSLGTAIPRARVHALMHVPYTIKGVASKFASSGAATAAWGMGYFLLMMLYLLILINSQLVMSSVAEEKTSRIAELLVSAISPMPLLYGKIAAATVSGLLQMAIWVAAGFLLGTAGSGASHAAAGASASPDITSIFLSAVSLPEVLAFVVLFALGFLQFSMLFAGIGSLINRTEDLGSVSMPIVLPVVGGLFLAMAALGVPDAPWAQACTFIPLVSPFVLFARIAMSDVPLWQIVVALLINVASAWIIAALAAKLYRVGMLLYGRPPSLKQIWSVIRS